MAIRNIIHYPDPKLRQKANKIRTFQANLKQLADDMLATMRSHDGVGLAGPQIGVMQRIFVAEISRRTENGDPHPHSGVTYILINPEIRKTAKDLVEGQEGCLSRPGWAGLVERPAWVEIEAQDLDGQPLKLKADGLLARIFFHEIDHLNGILYTDHITAPEKLWPLIPAKPEAVDTPAAGV
jgi:peptide deformylase